MEWAETQGIGTMTYGSLGGGILTGAIRELPKPDPKDMRQVFYPFFKEPVFWALQITPLWFPCRG